MISRYSSYCPGKTRAHTSIARTTMNLSLPVASHAYSDFGTECVSELPAKTFLGNRNETNYPLKTVKMVLLGQSTNQQNF